MPGVRLPSRPGVAVFAIAALIAGLALVFELGSWDVENDEAIYTYAVERMIDTGDWMTAREIPTDFAFLEKPALKFWFQTGTLDEKADRNKNGIIDSIDDTIDLIRELEAKGYKRPDDIRYMEVVGGRHDTATWAAAMPHFLSWAFGR